MKVLSDHANITMLVDPAEARTMFISNFAQTGHMSSKSQKVKSIGFKFPKLMPTEEERERAAGFPPGDVPVVYQHGGFFKDIPKPSHIDDWLAQYVPTNQNFRTWELTARKHKFATPGRQTIYFAPIGQLGQHAPSVESLQEYTEAFFQPLKVKVLDTVNIVKNDDSKQRPKKASNAKLTISGIHLEYTSSEGEKKTKVQQVRRCHEYYVDELPETHRQFAVDPLLDVLEDMLPDDAICLLGITMEDLFEGNTDNFTVGMATGPKDRIGIFSFCRYDPDFNVESVKKKSAQQMKAHRTTLLARSCKVLAHEILHMFGVDHCVWYDCMMNGSGWLEEDFAQSQHLCPVDLRKLLHCTKCDPVTYYEKLMDFYNRHDMKSEAEWIRRRLDFMNKNGNTEPKTAKADAEEMLEKQSKSETTTENKKKRPRDNNDAEEKDAPPARRSTRPTRSSRSQNK